MNRLLLFLCFVSVIEADQVVLKNGDTISGKIIKKDSGKLTVKSEFLGEVSVPWSAVTSVRSDDVLTVELPNSERVAGTLSTTGETLQINTTSGVRPVPLLDVGAMRNAAEQHNWERLDHPGLLQLWTGFFDTGLALARGNAVADTLTTSINATRATRKDKTTASFNQIYGTARIGDVSATVASALHGDWQYNRNVTPGFFVATLNSYDHNRFSGFGPAVRTGRRLGLERHPGRNAPSCPITGGADYNHESFTQGLTRTSGEAYFGDDLLYKLSGATNLTQSFRIFPNLSTTGQYRFNFDVSGVTAIKKWLGWHVTGANCFLSNPVFGRQRNDLLIATGLRVTFAR